MSDAKNEQPVDELGYGINLLILAKRPAEFAATVAFLEKRQWKVEVASDFKKAFEVLMRFKPQFALVSLDNPSLNVLSLVALLGKTFDVTSIGFCEDLDATSSNRLEQFNGPTLTGKVSGPTVHMKISTYLRTREEHQRIVEALGPNNQRKVSQFKADPASGEFENQISHRFRSSDYSQNHQMLFESVSIAFGELKWRRSATQNLVGNVERVGVIVVQEGGAKGYLLVALPKVLEAQTANFKMIFDLLRNALSGRKGPNAACFAGVAVFNQESFLEWSELKSTFTYGCLVANTEVLISYIDASRLSQLAANIRDPGENKMIAVQSTDLRVGSTVPCDLYLYSSSQQKPVCVLRKENILSAEKLMTLRSQGSNVVFIQRSDLEVFQIYFAEGVLASHKISKKAVANG